MRRTGTLFLFALVSIPRAAWPQGEPLGPEFRVNTYTTGYQLSPSVASDAAGNFVVFWDSFRGQDGSVPLGIFGQRYASSGTPLGPEFRVNTYTRAADPSVAADSSGNFVVVWAGTSGGASGIIGQRYANSGVPLGPEFRVNTYTIDVQSVQSVRGRRLRRQLRRRLAELTIRTARAPASSASALPAPVPHSARSSASTPTRRTVSAIRPSPPTPPATSSSSGTATNKTPGGGQAVFGQRYASSGTPLGPEFRVNSYTMSNTDNPSVAADPSGNFVVVWESWPYGSHVGVFGQRYTS